MPSRSTPPNSATLQPICADSCGADQSKRRNDMASTERSTTGPMAGERAGRDVHFEVEQFYYEEAELLDDGRFADWLELLAGDLGYWLPTRAHMVRGQQGLSRAAC